jgi:alpha-glucosidase
MTLKTLQIAMVPVLLALLISCSSSSTYFQLESPDKLVRVVIEQVEEQSDTRLYYSAYLKKGDGYQQIMDPSPLGIIREDGRFVENLKIISEEKKLNETDNYSLVTGKKLQVSNSYNESTLTFQNKDQKQIALVFRAYNDGIAFKYHFTGEDDEELTVTNELTGFDFKDGNFWGQPYDTLSTYTPAYETYYRGLEVGTEAPLNKNGWSFPILVESEEAWMMVYTQSSLPSREKLKGTMRTLQAHHCPGQPHGGLLRWEKHWIKSLKPHSPQISQHLPKLRIPHG